MYFLKNHNFFLDKKKANGNVGGGGGDGDSESQSKVLNNRWRSPNFYEVSNAGTGS